MPSQIQPDVSYHALLSLAQATLDDMKGDPEIVELRHKIKREYSEKGRIWSVQALKDKTVLEQKLERAAYRRYSADKPAGVVGLNEDEQQSFVESIKALAARSKHVDIRVQGLEKELLTAQTDRDLNDAKAFRVLPKDFVQRHAARDKVGARLTLNVDKAYLNRLAEVLPLLFREDNRNWLEQAKIMGPRTIGRRTDQAVFYLSSAGIKYAQTLGALLREHLPRDAFVDHTPMGMYRVRKGMAYSETMTDESSSHGQSRAPLIAAVCAQVLLTDAALEKTLRRTLQTRGYDVQNPAFLAQAVCDRELKGGQLSTGGGSSPRVGSADIHQFVADPVSFATSRILIVEYLSKPGRLPAQGRVQLVEAGAGGYEVEYVNSNNATPSRLANSIPAYFLGYDGANQASMTPAHLDIPKQPEVARFLFTATLSGCSLVVTHLNATTYRVYHDGRVNSSMLYDNVVMAVDFQDYQVPGTAAGLAAAYMQHVNGAWQLVLQRQESPGISLFKLRSGADVLMVQGAGNQVVARSQVKFAAYREHIHQQLRRMAVGLGVPMSGIVEGVYCAGEFSPDHPAIGAWNRLRKELFTQSNIKIQRLIKRRDTPQRLGPTHNEQIKLLNLTVDHCRDHDNTLLREASSVEKTWLWLQIKAKDGIAGVLRVDDTTLQSRAQVLASSQAEYIDKILTQAAVFYEHFQRAGSTFERLVPQDFYLSRVGDQTGGRCYPLVRAMAVALVSGGEQGADRLLERLFVAAADPQTGDSRLIKNSLIALHSNIEAVQSSISKGHYTLPDVLSLVKNETGASMFALNTQRHSMLLGATFGVEGSRYYFYDPNVGIFGFTDVDTLSQALHQHLLTSGLATWYGAFDNLQEPGFNVVEIDTDQMARVPVGYGLSVSDLTQPGALVSVMEQRTEADHVLGAHLRVAEDIPLHTALAILDAERWGVRLYEAATQLVQQSGLDNHWIPLIDLVQDKGSGHFRIPFIHCDEVKNIRWVDSVDPTFANFRRFVDKPVRTGRTAREPIRPRGGAGDAASFDGLSTGLMTLALIERYADKNRRDPAHEVSASKLAVAVNIHSYLNAFQMAHGVAQDVFRVFDMVSTALRSEALSAKTSSIAFHSLNAATGWLLAAGLVAMDAYELAYAESDLQKAVFGTQLAFDSASLGASLVGGAAGLVGFAAAATITEGAAVLLGGLSVGFTALVQAFSAVAEDAKAVGSYFHMLDTAYKNNGYSYDDTHKVLLPLPGAVIKSLDFSAGQIEFGSQYICSTEYTWAGDLPQIDLNREHAIEVRSGIGYRASHQSLVHSAAEVVVLPCTPTSYIAHDYGLLPFATARNDSGFEVARRLESERFSYDFYIFPGEQIIRRLRHAYVATTVEVVLDQSDRQLLVPPLPEELHGYLKYVFKGAGGEYLIGLDEGVSVELAKNLPSKWIIDSHQLESDVISIGDHQLQVGGVIVDIDPAQAGDIRVILHNHSRLKINFESKICEVESVDANQWSVPYYELEQRLQVLAKAHRLHGQYVVVENYRHNAHSISRGFYDVAKARMLFTTIDQAITEQARLMVAGAQLGAVTDEHAYFYNIEMACAWRTTVGTGQVDVQFNPLITPGGKPAIRLWQDHDQIYLSISSSQADKKTYELYQIQGAKMELVRMLGKPSWLQQLAEVSKDYAVITAANSPVVTLGRLREPSAAALVMVHGTDNAGLAHRYWIRSKDGTVIKPNLNPSTWPIPEDLVLVANMPATNDKEVFFFYSQGKKALFRQEGPGQALSGDSLPSALQVTAARLTSVANINGTLIAITEDGRVARVDALGRLRYEAVTERWLAGRSRWWNDLASVAGSDATLAVFGAKAADGTRMLPVWYHNGHVVVASPRRQGNALQFLGFEADGKTARLFEPGSKKLYFQPPMTPNELITAFGTKAVLNASASIPASRKFVPEQHLSAVEQVPGGLRLTLASGEIVLRLDNGELHLAAVDAHWQHDAVDSEWRRFAYSAQWRSANLPTLTEALSGLAHRWRYSGVLTLLGHGWFDTASGQVFSSTEIVPGRNVRFVGISPSKKYAFAYNSSAQMLYQMNENATILHMSLARVKRTGSTLLLQATQGCTLRPIIVAGVESLLLSGDSHSDTYVLSQEVWAYYRTVVVSRSGRSSPVMSMTLPRIDPGQILVSRYDDDLLLTDTGTGTVLLVRKAFSSRAVKHLQIKLADLSFEVSVERLVKALLMKGDRNDQLLSLEGDSRQFNILLKAVASAKGHSLKRLVALSPLAV